jgi:hypothetical protein
MRTSAWVLVPVLLAATVALSFWRAVIVQDARNAAASQTDEFRQAAMAVRDNYSRERFHQFLAATKKMVDAIDPNMRSPVRVQAVGLLAQCGWPPLWQGKELDRAMFGATWLQTLNRFMELSPMTSDDAAEYVLRDLLKDEYLNLQEAFWRGRLLATAAPAVAALSFGVLVCVSVLLVALVVACRGWRTAPVLTGAPTALPQ